MKDQIDALKRNLIINAAVQGLTSDSVKDKQTQLEAILKLCTNDVEFLDIKQRENWNNGEAPKD